jgi:mannan endo-1,4-beta-mannosidase
MKARLTMAGAAAAVLLASMLVGLAASPAQAQTAGFHISGRQLLDANNNPFVIRGISHPHVWFPGESASFAEIAALGANTVRVVLGSGHQWGPNTAQDLANVVNMCKQNQLICMLEVHDATGFGEAGAAVSINRVVSEYWTDPADNLLSVLQGEEEFVLINIANEPVGNNNAAQWVSQTTSAIQAMRTAGYRHTLVVDAPNWGQDWQFVMRDNATQIFNADPQDNILFSIHMYEVFGQAATITSYLNAFQTANLPLIVGEFGHMHNGQNVDEDTIMAEAQARGVGYIGWSYSGNSGGTEFLDMTVQFNPNSLTTWGQRIFNGANGIAATAQCATVFTNCGGGPGPVDPPAAPTGLTVTGSTANSVSLSWTASAGATSYQVQRATGATGGTFASVGTVSGTSFVNNTGVAANTTYRYRVIASNSAGASPPSSVVTVTTPGSGTGGGCTAVATVQTQWSSGYVVQPVTVTNTGTSATTGWTVSFTLPAGHTLAGSWNAQLTPTSGTITATNMGYNGNLQPNGNTTFGFQVNRPNGNTQTPSGFTCTAS